MHEIGRAEDHGSFLITWNQLISTPFEVMVEFEKSLTEWAIEYGLDVHVEEDKQSRGVRISWNPSAR